MNAGQLQSLKDLIEFLKQQEVGEFELEQDGLKVHLSFAGHDRPAGNVNLGHLSHLLQPAPAAAAVAAPAHLPSVAAGSSAMESPSAVAEDGLHIIKSPIVGTFYEASAPGAEPYIKVGDQVESGQVVCIVEAMKLMNEIEADIAGEIIEILVENGQLVEYGQPLFRVNVK